MACWKDDLGPTVLTNARFLRGLEKELWYWVAVRLLVWAASSITCNDTFVMSRRIIVDKSSAGEVFQQLLQHRGGLVPAKQNPCRDLRVVITGCLNYHNPKKLRDERLLRVKGLRQQHNFQTTIRPPVLLPLLVVVTREDPRLRGGGRDPPSKAKSVSFSYTVRCNPMVRLTAVWCIRKS